MTVKDYLLYWLTTASEDWETAQDLFKLKRYHHALFFCHLTLEKLLKGLVYKKTQNHAPPIHDLVKLACLTGLAITHEQEDDLYEITTWNIRARYDSYKQDFYKKATKEFATFWMERVKKLFLWLKNQY